MWILVWAEWGKQFDLTKVIMKRIYTYEIIYTFIVEGSICPRRKLAAIDIPLFSKELSFSSIELPFKDWRSSKIQKHTIWQFKYNNLRFCELISFFISGLMLRSKESFCVSSKLFFNIKFELIEFPFKDADFISSIFFRRLCLDKIIFL